MPEKKDPTHWVTKTAIGSLFRAVTLSTDPANTLEFTSSLISSTRAALIKKLESATPNSELLPKVMENILRMIINEKLERKLLTPEETYELTKQVNLFFKSESQAKYDLETYRDIIYCDDLRKRWKLANRMYLQSHDAWSISNEHLSDIRDQLMEIIIRHDLMQFSRAEPFSLDDRSAGLGQILEAVSKMKDGGD